MDLVTTRGSRLITVAVDSRPLFLTIPSVSETLYVLLLLYSLLSFFLPQIINYIFVFFQKNKKKPPPFLCSLVLDCSETCLVHIVKHVNHNPIGVHVSYSLSIYFDDTGKERSATSCVIRNKYQINYFNS